MSYALYVTHPEVVLDPAEPSSRWHLDERGRQRAAAFAQSAAMQPIGLLVASPETKTMETAELLAAGEREIVVGAETFENVRTATGVVPATEFEALMDMLYARPRDSAAGWETLAATEARIVSAVRAELEQYASRRPIAFVGHGTVGTVLKCHLAGRKPTRDEDQRRMACAGGGNIFAFSVPEMRLLTDWVAIEDFAGVPA